MSIVGSGSERGSISGQMSIGARSIDSIDEDKLELISNQMAVTFLELLAAMEDQCRGERDRGLSSGPFPSRDELIDSIYPLKPILMVLGAIIPSVNDGSFSIENRSTRRPNEWIRRGNLPLVSLEVSGSKVMEIDVMIV